MAVRVTQTYVEALIQNQSPNAHVTQIYLDALLVMDASKARITQFYIEIMIVGYGAIPATGRRYGPLVQMM